MPTFLNKWTCRAALVAGLSIVSAAPVLGQAIETGQRGAEIAPFAEAILLRPDWGQKNNFGEMAGVDFTRFIHSIVQPSLELRYTHATGDVVEESTFNGGIKLQATVRRIHPYATFLAGYGRINFTPIEGTYSSDNSFVYSLGGGADFDISQSWKVRADFSQQHWNLDPYVLTPQTLAVGVSYAIPFHGRGDVR